MAYLAYLAGKPARSANGLTGATAGGCEALCMRVRKAIVELSL
jgi:hypothetical protein